MRNKTPILTAIALLCTIHHAYANNIQPPDWQPVTAYHFSPPAKDVQIQSSQPFSGDGADCFYFPDVMIYEPGCGGADSGNAILTPNPASVKCSRTPPSYGITLKSDGYSLGTREGRFLIFFEDEFVDFKSYQIFDVKTGQELFRDGIWNDFTTNQRTNTVLHLRYTRGVELTCSLMSDSKTCWSKALATGQIPRGVSPGPPSFADCQANYFPEQNHGSTIDPHYKSYETSPSEVSYDVDVTLDINGHATIHPLGNLKCGPRG